LIDGRMWGGIVLTGAVMAVVTLAAMDLYLPGGFIEGSQGLATARTAAFTVLVLTQLMNAFSARSETQSIVHHLWTNPWLWAAVTLSFVLQVVVLYVPVLNDAFSTAPLTVTQWGECFALALVVPLVTEARKWWLRARDRRTAAL